MINACNPDIILISGDLIDNSLIPIRKMQMEEEMLQLQSRIGIYMVPGNHEYISGITECEKYITNHMNICFLRDSVVSLPNGFQIIGRDDRSNQFRKELPDLMDKIDITYPVIILDHQPVELMQTVACDADLLFCGHTHQGQIWPMSWITEALFDIGYGFEKRGHTSIYVSSGLSLWGPPYRIGTNSEFVVFNIFCTDKS